MNRVAAHLFGLLLGACGGSDSRGGTDDEAEQDAGADAGAFDPAPPASPEPPTMTPCPTGWREVVDAADPRYVTCDPWPEGGPQECADDEAHFPGEAACARIGSPCPVGDFEEDLPEDADVVYVLAGAAPGGDGTRERPFATIAEGLDAAAPDAILALSKGTFDETVTLSGPAVLWGACVEQTVVASSIPDDARATLTLSGRATVRNLRVSGARRGVYVRGGGADALLESVLVESATSVGVLVFEGGFLAGIDLVVRGTRADRAGDFGQGLEVAGGGRAELRRSVLDGNRTVALLAYGPGTELEATDVAVLRTLPWERGGWLGYGIDVHDRAAAWLSRIGVAGNRTAGIFCAHEETSLVADDLVVRDTGVQQADGLAGHGVQVYGGASASIGRVWLESNHAAGILAVDPGTDVVAQDVAIRDTRAEDEPGSDSGVGVELHGGSRVELGRAALRSNRGAGIFLFGAATALVATDVLVADTAPADRGALGGYGLDVSRGAQVDLLRTAFERNRAVGVIATDEGTVVVGTDVAVVGTGPQGSDARGGYGIQASFGAVTDLERVRVDGSHGFGVLMFGVGSRSALRDLLVDGTLEQGCVADGCPGFGTGLASMEAASLEAHRFRTSHAALCGVQLATGGVADLHDGEISSNVIGANVQTEGFDLARLQDGVVYRANERDLDSVTLPTPEPMGRTGG